MYSRYLKRHFELKDQLLIGLVEFVDFVEYFAFAGYWGKQIHLECLDSKAGDPKSKIALKLRNKEE